LRHHGGDLPGSVLPSRDLCILSQFMPDRVLFSDSVFDSDPA